MSYIPQQCILLNIGVLLNRGIFRIKINIYELIIKGGI
jgi:hypothetical protein